MAGRRGELSDDIMRQLRVEFIEYARETLHAMDENLRRGATFPDQSGPALLDLRRACHNLKGQGESFGFPTITILAHRMEDFLADVGQALALNQSELFVFIDWMTRIIESGVDLDEEQARRVIRKLPSPVRMGEGAEAVNAKPEALVVSASQSLGQLMRASLEHAGLKAINVGNPFDGLQIAARTLPDLVVTTVVMDGLSGVDIACALRAMPKTEKIPVLMVSSLPEGHPTLKRAPNDVIILPYAGISKPDFSEAALSLVLSRE